MLDRSGSMSLYLECRCPHGIVPQIGALCAQCPQYVTEDGNRVNMVANGGVTRLQCCKDSLFGDIFAKRLSAADNVGFVAFDHNIAANVPLGPWQGQHKATLENQLSALAVGGQTNMWNAVSVAISHLTYCMVS